jgi:hypothetical protein
MATLEETGLSTNLGLSNHETNPAQVQVAVFHHAINDIYTLQDIMASGFSVEDVLPEDGVLHLGKPRASTETFREPARKTFLRPVFTKAYYDYPFDIDLLKAGVTDDAEAAVVNNHYELEHLTSSTPRSSERKPTRVILGSSALDGFFSSSLNVLELGSSAQLIRNEAGSYLTGDDFIASRLVQLAEICGVDIKRHIPADHTERAIEEIITRTLIDYYFWLCNPDKIGSLGGNWHTGFMDFAKAYGLGAEEVADASLWFADEIHSKAQKRNPDRKLPELEPETAKRMAIYLVEGTQQNIQN